MQLHSNMIRKYLERGTSFGRVMYTIKARYLAIHRVRAAEFSKRNGEVDKQFVQHWGADSLLWTRNQFECLSRVEAHSGRTMDWDSSSSIKPM